MRSMVTAQPRARADARCPPAISEVPHLAARVRGAAATSKRALKARATRVKSPPRPPIDPCLLLGAEIGSPGHAAAWRHDM
jgi:hypothetical protein